MSSVKDLRNALRDEFNAISSEGGFEQRMLELARSRRSPDAKISITGSAQPRASITYESRRTKAGALVAALLAVAIVASLLFATHALKVVHPVPARGVVTTKPIAVTGPVALDCPANCSQPVLTFASPNTIWAVVDSTSDFRSTVYRTADGGTVWHALGSWTRTGQLYGWLGADRVVSASADGKEVLIIWVGSQGGGLIHSGDGGIHWQSYGLPASVQPASGADLGLTDYFLNPREGWLVSPEPGPPHMFNDVFHTTDSGAAWQLSGRVAATADLDLSRGRLVFATSTEAWYVPAYRASYVIAHIVYRSHDGGLTWTAVSLEPPSAAPVQYKPGEYQPLHAAITDLRFFNPGQAVIELQGGTCGIPISDASCYTWREGTTYAYASSDGGDTWSRPRLVADAGVVDFISAKDWVQIAESSTDSGTAFTTAFSTDGGMSWRAAQSSPSGDPRNLTFLDLMNGWEWGLACVPTVLRTTDGGANWTALNLPVVAGPTCGM